MTVEIVLVAAVARGGAIGRAGALPWRFPEDLRRFKALTLDHAVIMGRRTWASIGRPLPQRHNVVLSRDAGFAAPGATVVPSLDAAFAEAARAVPERPAMVIGGGAIYALAVPRASRLLLTEIELDVPGADAFFPEFDRAAWREITREQRAAADGTRFAFVDYARVS